MRPNTGFYAREINEIVQNTEKMWQDRRYEELQFQQTVTHLQQSAKDIFDQQEEEEDQQIIGSSFPKKPVKPATPSTKRSRP